MRTKNRRKPREPIASVLLVAMLLGTWAPALAQVAGTIYYQVTYENGKVRDIATLPKTNEDIRRVVRITRVNDGDRGVRAISTETPTFVSTGGRTYRHEMTWNGEGWVLHDVLKEATKKADPNAATGKTPTLEDILAEEAAELRKRIAHYRKQVQLREEAVAAAEDRLAEARSDDQRSEASTALNAAMRRRDQAVRMLKLNTQMLASLTGRQTRLGNPTGKVETPDGAPKLDRKTGGGVAEPVESEHILPHRVQVWEVTQKRKPRQGQKLGYKVSMAHPQPGRLGEFYYVAYVDEDDDGRPDRLIAHSPAARAAKAGGWTNWSFRTHHERVFVGNAWHRGQTAMYSRKFAEGKNWVGLGGRPWVSDVFGATPMHQTWPFLANLRVEVQVPWED
ncbi:MAG: hypothetical protein ACLFV7_12295 [Phycisphaerae bacterium]